MRVDEQLRTLIRRWWNKNKTSLLTSKTINYKLQNKLIATRIKTTKCFRIVTFEWPWHQFWPFNGLDPKIIIISFWSQDNNNIIPGHTLVIKSVTLTLQKNQTDYRRSLSGTSARPFLVHIWCHTFLTPWPSTHLIVISHTFHSFTLVVTPLRTRTWNHFTVTFFLSPAVFPLRISGHWSIRASDRKNLLAQMKNHWSGFLNFSIFNF